MPSRRSGPLVPAGAPSTRLLAALILAVLALRIISMALYPIMDTTEARYADISRLMLASGDWIVPQVQQGVPFWGKPPLFAWLTAGSFGLLGLDAFFARLPHFILGLLSLGLVYHLAGQHLAGRRQLLTVLILASTPLFFVSSGAVMTESGLLLSTTLAMSGFWLALQQKSLAWGLVFFAGLGLGLLAKGPIALVLAGLPIFAWVVVGRHWRQLLLLPWLRGLLLMLLIALPWYLAMEQRSPGFTRYFIVGEHFLRFVQSGWQGDLYGHAHSEPPGMIWLLWFQATAAWGLVLAYAAGRHGVKCIRNQAWIPVHFDQWQRYLLCWMLAPLVFFSFSGNILWTYVISGVPALALLLAGGQEAET